MTTIVHVRAELIDAGPNDRGTPYLGRCTTKGCRHTARILAETGTVTRRNCYGSYEMDTDGFVLDHRFYPFYDDRGYLTGAARCYFARLAPCPEHNRPLRWKRVKGTYNSEVRCDARCEGARRPDCECSCGGANHGSAHTTQVAPDMVRQ